MLVPPVGLRTTERIVTNPMENFVWGVEIATKAIGLLARYTGRELAASGVSGTRMNDTAAAAI